MANLFKTPFTITTYIPRSLNSLLLSVLDAGLGFVAMFLAMTWRYDFENKPIPDMLDYKAGLVFAATVFVTWMSLRVHRGLWRFTSLSDIRILLLGVFLVSIITPVIMFLFFNRGENFPRSVSFISGALFFGILTLIRLAVLLYHNGDIRALFRRRDSNLPDAILIGSEGSANNYIRDVSRKEAPGFNIRGIIISSDTPFKGRSIRGVPVLGELSDIEDVCARFAA